ncbi:hypothetical protein JVU11DRAFT_11514 [Chiua virens]|nr:hypothetical protein JVU11DRAFT_11514 [Chiua virens]
MPLENLPDTFDNATHDALDRAVNEATAESWTHSTSPKLESLMEYTVLLTLIVNHSNGDLDSKFTKFHEAQRLIQTHEDLRRMLAAGWERKSYREIRNLAILKVPEIPVQQFPEQTIPYQDLQKGLSASFEATYRGAAIDGFYEYLALNEKRFRNTNSPSYYAKFCSIVQSSGTGKSRMLTELSKKDVIVLYMNLRDSEPSLTDRLTFPARDPIPATILTEFPSNEEEYRIHCYAFFIALFDIVEEQLSTEHSTRNSKTKILRWAREMCDMSYSPTRIHTTRSDFFDKLSQKYNKARVDLVHRIDGKPVKGERASTEPDVDKNTDVDTAADGIKNISLSEPNPRRSDPPRFKFSTPLFDVYEKMTTRLGNIFPGDSTNPKLVIALDEAQSLSSKCNGGYRPADVFCRIVNEYSHQDRGKHAIWVVFASTTSRVADFSPPNKQHNSARVSINGEKLFEPYTQLGWDQNAPELRETDIKDISRLKHIASFGRPLWKSLETSLDNVQLVMDTASSKLCGTPEFDAKDTHQMLAVLGQRFGLDVALGHPDSVGHLEKGVASHMRICLSTTPDRIWRFTKYPSEPILSCAAAYALHDSPERLPACLENLLQALNGGMIDKGKRGEMASRLLWLLAKDLYVRTKAKNKGTEWPKTFDAHLADCQMISVVDWLEFVFGPQIWNAKEKKASTTHEAFKNAYLNFSHWVSMDTDINKSNGLGFDEWTLRHWMRTSAVQCCHQQPRIDKVIPIYFKGEHDKASAELQMSQIFISDKARESTDSKNELAPITRGGISGQDSEIPKRERPNGLPYIAIMADLGQPPSFSVTFPERETDDRCMRIYAAGIDTSTYPFLANHSALLNRLQELVHIAQLPSIERFFGKYLDAQVNFGSTPTRKHMQWEHGKSVPEKKRA